MGKSKLFRVSIAMGLVLSFAFRANADEPCSNTSTSNLSDVNAQVTNLKTPIVSQENQKCLDDAALVGMNTDAAKEHCGLTPKATKSMAERLKANASAPADSKPPAFTLLSESTLALSAVALMATGGVREGEYNLNHKLRHFEGNAVVGFTVAALTQRPDFGVVGCDLISLRRELYKNSHHAHAELTSITADALGCAVGVGFAKKFFVAPTEAGGVQAVYNTQFR